jgi:hypothetical protein
MVADHHPHCRFAQPEEKINILARCFAKEITGRGAISE